MKLANDSFDNAVITTRTVRPGEIDELGHVNNAVYVHWIQDAAISHWSAVASDALKNEFVWFCSRHEIDYKQQLYLEDEIEVRTWLGCAKGARFDRYVDIRLRDSDKVAVLAKTTWILVSRELKRPIRIKSDILSAFS